MGLPRLACLAVALGVVAASPVAAQPTHTVALASLRVRGPLARAAVQQVMEGSLDAYRSCLDARVAEVGRVAGELHVRVHVEANGVPIAASVDWSNVGDRPLERCVSRATEAWRLAETDSATQVSFTMRVGQGAPTGSERDVGAVISDAERDDAHLPDSARNTRREAAARARPVRRTWDSVEGGLRVTGALSASRVTRALRPRTAALRRCVSVPPVGSEEPAPWDVLLSVRVGANGRLDEEPVVQVPGAPPSVLACVAAILRDTRFPRAAEQTRVVARYRAVPRS